MPVAWSLSPCVSPAGVLVDVLSSRDLRGIGRKGQEFERLWMIVREFKQAVRRDFPDKTPTKVNFVFGSEKMVDVLSKMNDGQEQTERHKGCCSTVACDSLSIPSMLFVCLSGVLRQPSSRVRVRVEE